MQKHETIKRILTIAFLAMLAVLVSGCDVNLIGLSPEVEKSIKEVGTSIKELSDVMFYSVIGLTFMFVCIGVFFLVKARKVWKSMKAKE